MKISKLLKESLNLYQVKILIKVDKQVDRADIFNNLRGIPNVVIVKPKDSDYLNSKETDTIGYSFANVKFISNTSPQKDFKIIKNMALKGSSDFNRIVGLYRLDYNSNHIIKV